MYQIYTKYFRTKKNAHTYTKNILDKYKNQTISEGEVFNYLIALINLHYNKTEKIGKGIISFTIKNDYFKNTALFINQKGNDTEVPVSFVQICKFKPPTIREQYLESLRQCINNQILEFRNNQYLICDFCHTTKNIQIDHIYTFKDMVSDFETDYEFEFPTHFGKCKITNKTMFLEEDSELSTVFQEYHRNKATLRCLCSKCNLARNKY